MLRFHVIFCSSIYQTIPLTDEKDFKARAPTEDTSADILNDAHSLQLARLRFELSERKRYAPFLSLSKYFNTSSANLTSFTRLEAEKQSIQANRSSLIKENKEKKLKLEELERDLKEMLTKSDAIWRRFQEPDEEVEGEVISTQDTPLATDGQS